MRIDRFERLSPVCPDCRLRGTDSPLALTVIEAEREGGVETGILGCHACGAEYPILDHVPVIVPNVARYVQENLFYLLAREGLPPALSGLIGDAAGPGSAFDAIRQHVSSYAWDHWGDQDPHETADETLSACRPGAIVRAVADGLALLGTDLPAGPILDVGCGTGRSVAEFAARTGREVLGIDLSVPLARFAQNALRERRIRYDRRRLGLHYERRQFGIGLAWPEGAAEVWQCDVLALPFRPGSFALVAGLNVIDCLTDPRAGITAVASVLRPEGGALLCTPFDWSGNVTPQAAWLGGSARGEHAAEPLLARLLAETGSLHEIRTAEVSWQVRLHERSHVCYRSHIAVARRSGS